jgi:pilus assembly protein CpaB
MRPKSIVLIVIAMGCGLIASIGISQVMDRKSGGTSVETSEIFVTMVDVAIGQPLTQQMIKLEEWPKDKVPEGAINKLADIEGRRPKQPLYAGEPILHRKLIDQSGAGGASEKIPKGYRVMSVKVTMDSAASGLLLPGDRVDVIVYLRQGGGIPVPMTRTILTDVIVFAVNEQITRETDADSSTINAKTVSLLVKPDQVEKLMLATELGKLRLSLRRADDETQTTAGGASLDDLHSTERAHKPPTPTDDSLLGLLNGMKNQGAGPPQGEVLHTMEIHTPGGVSRFTWDDPSKLPRELAETGLAGATPPPPKDGSSGSSGDGEQDNTGAGGSETDSEGSTSSEDSTTKEEDAD